METAKARNLGKSLVLAGIVGAGLQTAARAQTSGGSVGGQQGLVGSSQTTTRKEAQEIVPHAAPDEKARLEALVRLGKLNEKGAITNFPGPVDTLLQDAGGIRSTLARAGIGVSIHAANTFSYNLLNNASPRRPKQYDGQGPTLNASIDTVQFTFDTGKVGIPNGQLIAAVNLFAVSRSPDGPTKFNISRLMYFQSLFDDHVEFKVGYGANNFEYVGIYGIGGNPVGNSQGAAGFIPLVAGFSYDPRPAPLLNITFKEGAGFYQKIGVQRSTSPLGAITEARSNYTGLNFNVPGAGALLIGETGIRRDFSPTGHQTWLRVGGAYNTSEYSQFGPGTGKSTNYFLWALADYQLVKTDPARDYRGIFIGGTVEYAPPIVNAYSQYFEGRIYSIGLFNARKTDVSSLVIGYNNFSRTARRGLALEGVATSPSQFSIGVTHNFHIVHGVYAGPALSYVDHPTFVNRLRSPLIFGLSSLVLF